MTNLIVLHHFPYSTSFLSYDVTVKVIGNLNINCHRNQSLRCNRKRKERNEINPYFYSRKTRQLKTYKQIPYKQSCMSQITLFRPTCYGDNVTLSRHDVSVSVLLSRRFLSCQPQREQALSLSNLSSIHEKKKLV